MERVAYEYQKFTGVNGGDSILNKIYTFAIANGWSATYYETNKEWNDDAVEDYYDWNSSGAVLEDHLELFSNGYGNQQLRFRFRNNQYSGSQHRLYFRAIEEDLGALDHGVATKPEDQNDWTFTGDFSYMSVPASTFPEMAIVGNDKIIMVFLFINSFTSMFFCFGSYELIPEFEGETELQMHFHTQDLSGGSWEELSDPDYNLAAYWNTVFYQSWYHTWWDGARSLGSTPANVRVMSRINRLDAWTYYWDDGAEDLCAINSYSGFRTLVSVPVAVKNSVDGTWSHIGYIPTYYIKWSGLEWGELITRGSDTYIVFPMLYTTKDHGVAIKINP